MFARLISARGFATSALRRSESVPPPPGDNLPFPIDNRSVQHKPEKVIININVNFFSLPYLFHLFFLSFLL